MQNIIICLFVAIFKICLTYTWRPLIISIWAENHLRDSIDPEMFSARANMFYFKFSGTSISVRLMIK